MRGRQRDWKSLRPPLKAPENFAAKTGADFLNYLTSNPTPATASSPGKLPAGGTLRELVGKFFGAFAYVTLDEGVY